MHLELELGKESRINKVSSLVSSHPWVYVIIHVRNSCDVNYEIGLENPLCTIHDQILLIVAMQVL